MTPINDQHKTKDQLIEELEQIRSRTDELECKRADEALHNLIEIIHFAEHVSTKIHGLMDEAEIYRTVKEAFAQSKQYTASILLLTDDDSSLRIAESSVSSATVKAGEKATGLRMKGYKIDLKKSNIYSQVVREGKTVQVNVSDIIGELFPRLLAHLISKTMGYEKKPCILTPLKRHGKIIGAFAMTPPELAEYFIPSVRNLAQHISNSLEWADEYAELKRAEEALKDSEEQFRAVVQSAKDSIILIDNEGIIHAWNEAADVLFQHNESDVIGKELYQIIVPERYHKSFKSGFEHFKTTGKGANIGKTLELTALRKDGVEFPIEMSLSAIKLREQWHAIGIIRDITDRKRAEAELKATQEQLRNLSTHLQSVREEDQAMLAREIHDELGQALTTLKFGIVELKNALPTDQISLVKKATSMAEYVDTIAQTVNRIATRLRPTLLDELGLVEAIEWEVEQFENRTGIKCELTVEPEEMVIDQDRSTAIYRIVQEALTNIARHAQATRSAVTLKMSGGKLHLSITDNGIGIAEDQVSDPKSLGIIGMRERVLSVGGNFEINRIKKGGTKIMVIIPVENES